MTFKMLKGIFKTLVFCTSEKFRSYLESWIRDMYEFAKKTDNPFDDYFIEYLAEMMDVDLGKKKENPYVKVSKGIKEEYRRW